MSFRIKNIWAFTAIDKDDEEGICAFLSKLGPTPMIASDEARLKSLRPIAEAIAKRTGRPVQLSRFMERTDLEVIEPPKGEAEIPRSPDGYEEGAELTVKMVRLFKATRDVLPVFAMPPRILVAASLDHDIVAKMARNDAARELVQLLLATFEVRGFEPPTLLMLQASLELNDIPIEAATLAELGIDESEVMSVNKGRAEA